MPEEKEQEVQEQEVQESSSHDDMIRKRVNEVLDEKFDKIYQEELSKRFKAISQKQVYNSKEIEPKKQEQEKALSIKDALKEE